MITEPIEWISCPDKWGAILKAVFICPRCRRIRWVKKNYYHRAIRKGTWTGFCRNCRTRRVVNQYIDKENPRWKGERHISATGYYLVKVYKDSPFYVMGDHQDYVLESRLIMAQHIGRVLTEKETVHHIDGSKDNNDIENLILFPDLGSHTKYHAQQRLMKAESNGALTGVFKRGLYYYWTWQDRRYTKGKQIQRGGLFRSAESAYEARKEYIEKVS